MTAASKPTPLAWAPMEMLGGGTAQSAGIGRSAVQVWDSGKGARPWRVLLSRDGYGVEYVGRCESEDSAKASAEKRLRKAVS